MGLAAEPPALNATPDASGAKVRVASTQPTNRTIDYRRRPIDGRTDGLLKVAEGAFRGGRFQKTEEGIEAVIGCEMF